MKVLLESLVLISILNEDCDNIGLACHRSNIWNFKGFLKFCSNRMFFLLDKRDLLLGLIGFYCEALWTFIKMV